jgi:hypothetical protein
VATPPRGKIFQLFPKWGGNGHSNPPSDLKK